jgi:hypothetical protein
MLLPSDVLGQNWKVCQNPCSLPSTKQYYRKVVESQYPHGMPPTSSPIIYKVFVIIHMLWGGIRPPSCCYHCKCCQIWILGQNSRSLPFTKKYYHTVLEAPYPHGMPPTSTLSIRCTSSLICCGWAEGTSIVLLPSQTYLGQIWK